MDSLFVLRYDTMRKEINSIWIVNREHYVSITESVNSKVKIAILVYHNLCQSQIYYFKEWLPYKILFQHYLSPRCLYLKRNSFLELCFNSNVKIFRSQLKTETNVTRDIEVKMTKNKEGKMISEKWNNPIARSIVKCNILSAIIYSRTCKKGNNHRLCWTFAFYGSPNEGCVDSDDVSTYTHAE